MGTEIGLVASGFVSGILLTAVTLYLVMETRAVRQANRISVRAHGVDMSNDRNWRILEIWEKITPPRSDWVGRSYQAMARRMILVNELNLLQWAFFTSAAVKEAMPEKDKLHWQDKVERMLRAAAELDEGERTWLREQIEFEIGHYDDKGMQDWLTDLVKKHLRSGGSGRPGEGR